MCVLYVSFRSTVSPRTCGCVAMGSAVLFILRSSYLYSTGSGVNIVRVVLSGFNARLLCFVQVKTLCIYYGCMCFLAALVFV